MSSCQRQHFFFFVSAGNWICKVSSFEGKHSHWIFILVFLESLWKQDFLLILVARNINTYSNKEYFTDFLGEAMKTARMTVFGKLFLYLACSWNNLSGQLFPCVSLSHLFVFLESCDCNNSYVLCLEVA